MEINLDPFIEELWKRLKKVDNALESETILISYKNFYKVILAGIKAYRHIIGIELEKDFVEIGNKLKKDLEDMKEKEEEEERRKKNDRSKWKIWKRKNIQ